MGVHPIEADIHCRDSCFPAHQALGAEHLDAPPPATIQLAPVHSGAEACQSMPSDYNHTNQNTISTWNARLRDLIKLIFKSVYFTINN